MDKTTIETLIEKKLGIKTTIETERDFGKSGIMFEGVAVPTTKENSGVFANFFNAFRAKATVWQANAGSFAIDMGVRWYHHEGGENGASVIVYYFPATGELLDREAAAERIKATTMPTGTERA